MACGHKITSIIERKAVWTFAHTLGKVPAKYDAIPLILKLSNLKKYTTVLDKNRVSVNFAPFTLSVLWGFQRGPRNFDYARETGRDPHFSSFFDWQNFSTSSKCPTQHPQRRPRPRSRQVVSWKFISSFTPHFSNNNFFTGWWLLTRIAMGPWSVDRFCFGRLWSWSRVQSRDNPYQIFFKKTNWYHSIMNVTWWRHQMETFFRVTGPLWGESTTCQRRIPLTEASEEEL